MSGDWFDFCRHAAWAAAADCNHRQVDDEDVGNLARTSEIMVTIHDYSEYCRMSIVLMNINDGLTGALGAFS